MNLIVFFALVEVHHAYNTVMEKEQEWANVMVINEDSEEEVCHVNLDENGDFFGEFS